MRKSVMDKFLFLISSWIDWRSKQHLIMTRNFNRTET